MGANESSAHPGLDGEDGGVGVSRRRRIWSSSSRRPTAGTWGSRRLQWRQASIEGGDRRSPRLWSDWTRRRGSLWPLAASARDGERRLLSGGDENGDAGEGEQAGGGGSDTRDSWRLLRVLGGEGEGLEAPRHRGGVAACSRLATEELEEDDKRRWAGLGCYLAKGDELGQFPGKGPFLFFFCFSFCIFVVP